MLLRRIMQELAPLRPPAVLKPIRVSRSRFVKQGVLEGYVDLAAQRVGAGGGILILLDANGACPARLGPAVLARAAERARIGVSKQSWRSVSTRRGSSLPSNPSPAAARTPATSLHRPTQSRFVAPRSGSAGICRRLTGRPQIRRRLPPDSTLRWRAGGRHRSTSCGVRSAPCCSSDRIVYRS